MASAAFSPSGRLIATAGADSSVRVWDARSLRQRAQFREHRGYVAGVAFAGDDDVLSGGQDGRALLTPVDRPASGTPVARHDDLVTSVARVPDQERALTTSTDGRAQVSALDEGSATVFRDHGDEVYAGTVDPSGELALTGGADRMGRVWALDDGEGITALRGHGDAVYSVALSPDGRFALTGSGDRTARLWNPDSGRVLDVFEGHGDLVSGVAFDPRRTRVATASFDGVVRIFDCEICAPVDDLLSLAGTRVTRGLTRDERELYLHE